MHKGDLTLAFHSSSTWSARRPDVYPFQDGVGDCGLDGGGGADRRALAIISRLKMNLRAAMVPANSGVLPRNRVKLIDGIADTIEKQWLTPDMIGKKAH